MIRRHLMLHQPTSPPVPGSSSHRIVYNNRAAAAASDIFRSRLIVTPAAVVLVSSSERRSSRRPPSRRVVGTFQPTSEAGTGVWRRRPQEFDELHPSILPSVASRKTYGWCFLCVNVYVCAVACGLRRRTSSSDPCHAAFIAVSVHPSSVGPSNHPSRHGPTSFIAKNSAAFSCLPSVQLQPKSLVGYNGTFMLSTPRPPLGPGAMVVARPVA